MCTIKNYLSVHSIFLIQSVKLFRLVIKLQEGKSKMIGAGGAKVKKGLLHLKPASKQNKTKYCPVKHGY